MLVANISGDIEVSDVTGEFVVRYGVYGSYDATTGVFGQFDEDASESNVFRVAIDAGT
jgi:hypothetical protein